MLSAPLFRTGHSGREELRSRAPRRGHVLTGASMEGTAYYKGEQTPLVYIDVSSSPTGPLDAGTARSRRRAGAGVEGTAEADGGVWAGDM